MGTKLSDPSIRLGFFQALGVTLYCSFVGLFFWKGNELFGKVPNFFGPVAFLLLFSVSALLCGLIVFYQPYKFFFDNKRKEAADLVLATAGWLFLFFIIFLVSAVFLKV